MIKLFTPFVITLLFSTALNAQEIYFSGFDDASQQEGWTEYKTAATTFSHWTYSTEPAYSAPNCIYHDYSPATGITLTDNWFVSPSFALNEGGVLDSIRYRFSGFSIPEVGDTIGVYLLLGSQDPDLASSKQLLFDFRGDDYVADGIYHQLLDITLPISTEEAYIAIRYRNSDCSSRWLTVNFDNIAISHSGYVSIEPPYLSTALLEVYPNPTKGQFTIKSSDDINSIEIFNILGASIYSKTNTNLGQVVPVDLSTHPKGVYIAHITIGNKAHIQKITVH